VVADRRQTGFEWRSAEGSVPLYVRAGLAMASATENPASVERGSGKAGRMWKKVDCPRSRRAELIIRADGDHRPCSNTVSASTAVVPISKSFGCAKTAPSIRVRRRSGWSELHVPQQHTKLSPINPRSSLDRPVGANFGEVVPTPGP